MPPSIFISYRRDDAAGDAGRLADHLHRRFGAARVFIDVDTIDPGADFVRVLRESLEQTAVMLVVIGPRWTLLRAADGTRRLDAPDDFVRLEVEAALGRGIPVVPVLVQGAVMPRREDVPASLAPLVTRQAAVLDHAEFHDDAERLCNRLAPSLENNGSAFEQTRRADALIAEALVQHRRGQAVEALATLARARESAPGSEAVRRTQEDVAMAWIRNVRVQSGTMSFAEAIKPALAVVDASLARADGVRRADLLAHSGWASFLMWRDGQRQLDPAEWYREALALDPQNPYANAMLAHWVLQRGDDVPRAAALFATALESGRASEAVRVLQWAGYGNTRTPEADAERVRLADAMRRNGEKLTMRQAHDLWSPYYFAMTGSRDRERQRLLAAVPPDDHLSTLGWAFEEYAANEESRRQIIRYYAALLHASAGRADRAADELRTLDTELADRQGSLRDAVQAALESL
jgi:hypothetical protein